jgi:hypothetical protein
MQDVHRTEQITVARWPIIVSLLAMAQNWQPQKCVERLGFGRFGWDASLTEENCNL